MKNSKRYSMKKIILLALTGTILIAGTTIKRNSDSYDNIRFTGIVKDIDKFSKHVKVKVKRKKEKDITLRLNYREYGGFREGQTISGSCDDKKFNQYINCNVYAY